MTRRVVAGALPLLAAVMPRDRGLGGVLRLGHPGPLVLPTPGAVLRALHEDAGTLARAALVTAEEAFVGFVCGTVTGLRSRSRQPSGLPCATACTRCS